VYINDPFLIEGLKFDLRIYVLIMGSESLRIFVYKEGLVRFATENYQKAQNKNVKNIRMHLTNYAINKNSKNFVFNKSHKNMNEGHKRSITATFNYLKKLGKDTE
jgi:tubulin polyglutamylase TTLL6/13